MLLKGKTALVTGAGHGIGRGHALELARYGAKVVVNDLGGSVSGGGAGSDADVVVDLIRSRGGEAIADYGDVGDEDQANAMVQRAIDEWGSLNILVNNAGIVRDRAIWNMSAEDFDLVLRVHLRGTFLTCRAAARYWREISQERDDINGRIINTTSGAGLLGNFGQANYTAAKGGIVAMTLTLSIELAKFGVTANVIGPGALTRLSAGVEQGTPREPDEIPGDVWDPGDPATSSPVVAWLASDEAQFVSGQVIRAMRDKIWWMNGWTEAKALSSGKKRWKAEELGRRFATDVFGTRAPGLRLNTDNS
jgi:NAD(P)-dependent dehydrogenase (short-subunit alcohol dehydrogenase family)